jgi:hypothetical protein
VFSSGIFCFAAPTKVVICPLARGGQNGNHPNQDLAKIWP